MKLLPYALSLASLVGALMLTTPAAAQPQTQIEAKSVSSTCGAWRCGFNGVTLNGFSLNGFSLNGVTLNGLGFNGFSLNGLTLNGFSLNGVQFNGFTVNGVAASGVTGADASGAEGPSVAKGSGALVACAEHVAGVCKPGVVAITLAGGQRLTVD